MDSKYDSFIHFTIKFNSKDYSISFCSGIFNLKSYSKTFFSGKFNSWIDSKIWICLYSVQQNIHSIRKPGYQRPLTGAECHVPVPRISIVETFAIWRIRVKKLLWRKNEAKILMAELSRPAPILEIDYRGYHGRRTKDDLGRPKSWDPWKSSPRLIHIYVIFGIFAFCGRKTKADFKDALSA